MAIDFPNSPTTNDSFTAGGKKWIFNGTSWTLITANAYTIPTGEVTTAMILDGTILNVDINASAAIDQSKISGLTADLAAKAPLASPTFTGTVSGVTKTMVGLGSVDNTADTSKPVSTAQQTALDLKANLASPAFTGNITATGAMTATGAPSFHAERSSALSYNNSAQVIAVVFNSVSYNIGNHYNSSTGLFTAPYAGDYFYQASLYNSGGADTSQVWVVKNGARQQTFATVLASPGYAQNNMAGAGIIRLAVNDTFGIAGWYGGASVSITDNFYHTYFNARYIG